MTRSKKIIKDVDRQAIAVDTVEDTSPPRRPVGRPRKDGTTRPVAGPAARKVKIGAKTGSASPHARRSGSLSAQSSSSRGGRARGNGRARSQTASVPTGAERARRTAASTELASTITYGEGTGRGSAKLTRKRILAAARLLFARHGMDGVSVRAIAEEAGVNHALVHRYFGNKMDMVTEIVQNEVKAFGQMSMPQATADFHEDLVAIRAILRHVLTDMKTTILLILRAEMDGLKPSQLLHEMTPRATGNLAEWIASQQATANAEIVQVCGPLPDPNATAMIISGAMFTIVAAEPWLATAVNLTPDMDDSRRELLLDTIIGMLALAAGRPLNT